MSREWLTKLAEALAFMAVCIVVSQALAVLIQFSAVVVLIFLQMGTQ